MSKTHELKTITPYFQDVVDGKKLFEIRFNDRRFRTGDFLKLVEYSKGIRTGRFALVKVTYIFRNMGMFGLPLEYVVMSILLLTVDTDKPQLIAKIRWR